MVLTTGPTAPLQSNTARSESSPLYMSCPNIANNSLGKAYLGGQIAAWLEGALVLRCIGNRRSQERANNLYSLTDKRPINGKKNRGKTKRRRKGKHSVESGQRLTKAVTRCHS